MTVIRTLFIIFFALNTGVSLAQPPAASFTGTVDLNGTAEDWQLEQADWEDYLTLMRGPSGLLYANMSPFYVLGVNAEDPARQRHFAQRSIDLNEQRLRQVLQFYRVQQKLAAQRSDAGQASRDSVKKMLKPSDDLGQYIKTSLRTLPPTGRLSAYLAIHQCPQCEAIGAQLIRRGDVDFYFVDADSDDAIRRWAAKHNIDIDAVMRGDITLNNDTDNVFSSLNAGDPPAIFRQGAGGDQ